MMRDPIERQDAIDAFDKQNWSLLNIPICKEIRNAAKDTIRALPSVQPERKKGKWIDCDGSEHWKCDKCGCRAGYWFNEENSSSWELDMSEWLSDFCPNCGADMREGDTT